MCRRRLDGVTAEGKAAPAGEAAHIIGEKQAGPRGKSIFGPTERNSYFNLILLCPTCHTLIDKDPAEYPVEKLHMLKASHELRVQGNSEVPFPLPFQDENSTGPDLDAIVSFVRSWSDFLPFYATLFNLIQLEQMDGAKRDFLEDDTPEEIPQWHRRRDELKEMMFRATEQSLIVQRIPDWERLRRKSPYIADGGYLTPFSFMLDFVNPYSMVLRHGDELWAASNISHEFIDFLSFKYEEVKQVWRTERMPNFALQSGATRPQTGGSPRDGPPAAEHER